ncbi:MAG TPA: hypothetical protein VK212_09490 [Lentimicrobium sp.]|nr:hypothetical protein [Lentimicrobium sp.]
MRILINLVIFFLLINQSASSQQAGCTDSLANNFNPEAVINDGSCHYAFKSIKPPVIIGKLPATVTESSGLLYWKESYWTQNDSDGKNELYRLDNKTGEIIQKVKILNAANIDWEEITQDENFIYIGDFGNNRGNRKNLTIYKVNKADIPSENDTSLYAYAISFAYGDQIDFTIKNLKNDFDCEAMISSGDSLYLFSKNWVHRTTRLYSLPKTPGRYTIFPLDEYNVNGLITGAALDEINKTIVLCGYWNYFPFIWILNDFQENNFFSGNKRRIELVELFSTQTEAVAYISDQVFVISCESTPLQNAKIFRLDLKLIK